MNRQAVNAGFYAEGSDYMVSDAFLFLFSTSVDKTKTQMLLSKNW